MGYSFHKRSKSPKKLSLPRMISIIVQPFLIRVLLEIPEIVGNVVCIGLFNVVLLVLLLGALRHLNMFL